MAYTASFIYKIVQGNKRVHAITCTADAASGTVASGLRHIESIVVGDVSMATASPVIYANIDSDSSSAANGTVFISSAASGDGFTIICTGT